MMRFGLAVPAALLTLAMVAPASQAARHASHHNAGRQQQAARPAAPAFDANLLAAEVMLDRAGFSPGVIDGRDGDNFENALHAFQQANGLPVGRLDAAALYALQQGAAAPALAQYTIEPQDVAGPFTPTVPRDYAEMAQLPRLSYRSPQQLLAEKFHMSEALLAQLNPGKDLAQPGTVIAVANVGAAAAPAAAARGQESAGSSTEPSANPQAGPAALVVVDKRQRAVLVYGADKRLAAFYPASIGSAEKPAPSGNFEVRSVTRDPSYTYNPAYAFKGQTAQQKVTVAPGPNNPVGLVWIALSLKGYGIHGTPEPDKVGKTQSHGCVRLTNWDALALARLVRKGTPVQFLG